MKKIFILLLGTLLLPAVLTAQTITGTVTDDSGEPLPFASVLEKGTTNGTNTDAEGKFTLKVTSLPVTFIATFVGYVSQSIEVTDATQNPKFMLDEGSQLDEIVVTGNRANPRTVLDSPIPIDNISAKELRSSGKVKIEEMLMYKVPSFNSNFQAISDATAHFDPADLRGLGPSRTLVLINGKRKNQSAQIYLNGTPGKGEVGIDMKGIPSSAIERIEVLRDGASAQYGSDAIAGVINIILKDDAKYSVLNTYGGVTLQGDGFNFGTDFNTNFKLGKGSVNLSLEYYNQQLTNRAGSPGVKDLPAPPNPNDYTNGSVDENYLSDVRYHDNLVDWATENPQLGMIVGQPDMTKKSGMFNLTYPLGDNAEFYTFNSFTVRGGRSFAYYRAPYWREDVRQASFLTQNVEDFVGYHPTFEAEVIDNLDVGGFKFDLAGFKTDLSVTYGRNYVDYTVNRSVNRDYLADHNWSPRTFNPGGYAFSNLIGNLDFVRSFNDAIYLSFGAEAKRENYVGHQGDEVSYYGGGSDSFAGIKPEEAMNENRISYAGYAGIDYDITSNLLLGAAGRYEDFSDFGSNFSWKVNGRYKIGDIGAVRASYSTGFRAPSLHQRYIRLTQYIIVAGSPDPQLQGTLPNNHPAVQALGVPSLFAETSTNITGGVTFKITPKLSLSTDVYSIDIRDRVLFSSQIQGNDDAITDPIEQILIDEGVTALQFFINAVNTKTLGADIVLNLNNIMVGPGKFGATLAANFNENKIDGAISNPPILEENGYEIFNRREAGRITDARPKSKVILGLNYKVAGFNFILNNTRFGEVTVFHETDATKDQVHSAKIVTDLVLAYNISKQLSVHFTANNIFDVYPDILFDDGLRNAGGRFLYSSEVTQMGFNGATFSAGLSFTF